MQRVVGFVLGVLHTTICLNRSQRDRTLQRSRYARCGLDIAVSIGPNGTVLCNVKAGMKSMTTVSYCLNRSQRDRTLQPSHCDWWEERRGRRVSIGPNGTVLCNKMITYNCTKTRLTSLNRSQRDRTLQRRTKKLCGVLKKNTSQSVPTGPYFATTSGSNQVVGGDTFLSQSVPTGPYFATLQSKIASIERGLGLNRSQRDRTLQLKNFPNMRIAKYCVIVVSIGPNGTVLCNSEKPLIEGEEGLSQSVPTGPYFATLWHGSGHNQGVPPMVSIGPNGTVLCNRLFCDCDDHFTRNSLLINCLQINLPTSSKFDESVSPPSHSLAVFVIRSFRPPGLCLGSHHPPRTTYKSIKPTGPIQGACR